MNPPLAPLRGLGKNNTNSKENTSHNLRKSATESRIFRNNCDRNGRHPKLPPHNLRFFR